MSNQLQITGGAKVRSLEGVITGTTGVLSSLPINTANGIPQLDSSGKILVSQLPNSVMEYQGTWNVATNTPYLVNGVGNAGDVYLVTGAAVGGTNHNFGAGNILFYNGDQAIYDGSQYQRASGSSGTVTSVGLSTTGNAFSIGSSPITTAGTITINGAGTSSQYINGAGDLTTFPSLTGYVPYTGATNDLNLGTHNLFANNFFDGFTNVAASGTQIVLTIASTPSYTITGSGGQTIKLPDATTLPNGAIFSFNNNQSSGAITINNNSNTLVVSVPSGGFAEVVLLDNSIAAGSWDRHFKAPSNVSWSTNTLDYAGSITSATWNGNVVAINRGGTGSSTQNFVDLTTTQTIAGAKTFSSNLTANSFIKIGGGNLQFLKADGSVDSTAYVQYVTATSPLVRTGATNTPILSIPAATTSVDGYLTSTDWNTFNNKATVSGSSGRVAFYNGSNSLTSDSYFNFNSTTKRLSIGDFSVVSPPAALSMISTIGAWYNRNTANTVNYNDIGLYYDGTGYGHLIQTNRVGASSDYSRISFINNNTSFVLDEDYNVGINTRTPTPGSSGPGGVGLDIWGGAQTASLAFHNTASGSTTSDGGRLYLVNAGNLLLRNLETGSVIVSADNGDVVLQAGGFEKLRAISGGNVSVTGSLQQSAVTSAILKASSTGVIVAAVAGTDYLAVGSAVTSVTGTSPVVSSGGTTPAISMAAATTSVSGYLTSTDWNTFNGKFTLPSLTAGSVLFSNGSTIAQNNTNFFWDNTNSRLGLGTNTPGSLLTLFGAGDNTYFNILYTGGSIASIEAVGTSVSGYAKLNLGKAGTTNVVINGFGNSYFTGGNLGVGINSPTYRLHVSGTLGVTSDATFSLSITANSFIKSGGTSSQFLKADGSVDSTAYGTGTVTSVTGTAPVVSSGGAAPAISMAAATASVNGYLTSTNFTTFNNKFTLPSLTAGSVLFSDGSTIAQSNSNFFWDNTAKALKITSSTSGSSAPYALHVVGTNSIIMAENPNATGVAGIRINLNGFTQTSLAFSSISNNTSLSSNYGSLQLLANGTYGLLIATSGATTFDKGIGVNGYSGSTSYAALFSGSVGIGTTSPPRPLTVISYLDDGAMSSGGNLYSNAYFGTGGIMIGTQSTTGNGVIMMNTNKDTIFGNWNGSTNAERMRITSGGLFNFLGTATTTNAQFVLVNDNSATTLQSSNSGSVPKDMIFGTPTERMRITSSGSVGIGMAPLTNYPLSIKQTSTYGLLVQAVSNDRSAFLFNNGTDAILSADYSSTGGYGGVQIRTNDTQRFRIAETTGAATFSSLANTTSNRAVLADTAGTLSAPVSDISVKQNIKPIEYGLNEILKMNPVWFDFIDEYKNYGIGRQNGNIAQEMELIIPEAVFTTPSTGKMGIEYSQLHAVYIKAIQEMNATITSLQDRLDKLENK
jgi:hypothetical protein